VVVGVVVDVDAGPPLGGASELPPRELSDAITPPHAARKRKPIRGREERMARRPSNGHTTRDRT
jgi:hypothetical protein